MREERRAGSILTHTHIHTYRHLYFGLLDDLDSKHRLERAYTHTNTNAHTYVQAHSCSSVPTTNQTNSLTCHESYWNMATKCSNDNSK